MPASADVPASSETLADVRAFFAAFEAAPVHEDVEDHIRHFSLVTVWVTSRGVCHRGRDSLADSLRAAIPGRFVKERSGT